MTLVGYIGGGFVGLCIVFIIWYLLMWMSEDH